MLILTTLDSSDESSNCESEHSSCPDNLKMSDEELGLSTSMKSVLTFDAQVCRCSPHMSLGYWECFIFLYRV